MKQLLILLLIVGFVIPFFGQSDTEEDARMIQEIHAQALTNGSAYDWLRHLSKDIGPRPSGSSMAAAAVHYGQYLMDTLGLDSVWLQPCMVPHWVRGEKEVVRIAQSAGGSFPLRALALGNSGATPPEGLRATVIEVEGLDELRALAPSEVEGKIVFFNRPFDNTRTNTFRSYGGAVDQRGSGPALAADLGAVATLVRSMTGNIDTIPHTGGTYFGESPLTPAVAISTVDAELLAAQLKLGPVEVYLKTNCRLLEDQPSYNVIGEITGSEFPDEIILVGGHLDSWDVGEGAHDDGAGVVHALEVLNVLQQIGYRPRYTIRCVWFMNEENGLRGARAYWKYAFDEDVQHFAAIESDRGGFSPHGFTVDAHSDVYIRHRAALDSYQPLLAPYGINFFKGGSGADIGGLKDQKGILLGLMVDSQRYFDYHHTPADVFETVHWRELAMGSAAMTAMVYLLDKYGLKR